MQLSKCFLPAVLLASAHVHATLPAIPTPVDQGGMVHAEVTFLDQATGSFSIHLETPEPEMAPLTIWAPGEDFDPSDPWYSTLDPSQQAKPFSSRYGLMLNAAESDFLPAGKAFGVRLVSISDGLTGYFYRGTEGSEQFDAVFTNVGDTVLWSGNMWHPLFVADGPGIYEASLEFFIADESFAGFVEPTTAASDPGYQTQTVTLTMTAVPEPATTALALGSLALALMLIRRRRAV